MLDTAFPPPPPLHLSPAAHVVGIKVPTVVLKEDSMADNVVVNKAHREVANRVAPTEGPTPT